MEKKKLFTGAATALITPLTPEGVDYPRLAKLIDWQIEQGISALVICGSTGEPSTLTDDEHRDVLRFAAKQIAGRVPMIAGAGSNDTDYAIDLARVAKEAGADGALVVTPYYNKATQKGLIKHFSMVAEEGGLPVILYNVPSRTGVTIEPATYEALAEHPGIVAIKEASGAIAKTVDTMSRVAGKLTLYSGNDEEIVPLMSIGAQGVISVLSNLLPAKTNEICTRFLSGDVKGAAAMQLHYRPLIDALFCEVNPIPVKAAMAALGFCDDYLRMPLTSMEPEHKANLLALMRKEGLNV